MRAIPNNYLRLGGWVGLLRTQSHAAVLTAALLHNTGDPKQLFKLCGWAEQCAHRASGVYRGSTTCELKLPLSTPTYTFENRKKSFWAATLA